VRILQEIQDYYENQGYSGDELRKVLEKDKEYQKLLNKRKEKLRKEFSITKAEQRKYVMSRDADYEILSKVKKLEKLNLTKEDKSVLKLIRTQLEYDWRKYLIQELNKILRKYKL